MKRKILLISILLIFVGCANQPEAKLEGSTLANQILITDTMNMVKMYNSALGCSEITGVESEVISKPTGKPGERTWTEKWLVAGCGATNSYTINFTEDGVGGAFFAVSKT